MRDKWELSKLADIAVFKNGKSRPTTEGVYPVYGGNGILEYANDYNSEKEAIIVGRVGAYCGSIFYENRPIWVSDNAMFALPQNKYSTKFLYYLLKNLNLNRYAQGSSHPLLTQTLLNEIRVLITKDIATQQSIASILSSLDDKIEINRQMNHTLEVIAQAIFKEWFVHFHFPGFDGQLVDGLPKGWKKYVLTDLIDTVSLTHKFPKEKAIFLNTSDILDGEFLHDNYSNSEELPGQAKKSIKNGDILLSEIRPANKRFAYVDFEADDYVVSTKLMVLRSKGIIDNIAIYYFLKRPETLQYLQLLAECRSGTFPQITYSELSKLDFNLPDKKTLSDYTNFIKSLHEKIRINQKEIRTLAALRDTLLPKLMSGKIEVKA